MEIRHRTNALGSTYPFRIVDDLDKIEEYLPKDRLGFFVGANSGDDCVHIDT